MSRKPIDLKGRQFGRLSVTREAEGYRSPGGQLHRQWLCLCACGETAKVRQQHLLNGHTESCGCASRDSHTTHGMSKTPAYRSWKSMMSRCYSEKDIGWKHYGGRGIGVCDRWHDFLNFASDMGQPPKGMSIDRIDPDGDYGPGNCRWADRLTQSNNRRSNVRLYFRGKEMTIAEWAREIGVSAETLKRRIDKGWPTEDALTIPVGHPTDRLLASIKRLHLSGESSNRAKMTFEAAERMREYKSENPDVSLEVLGNQFGVGKETARKVIRRLAW